MTIVKEVLDLTDEIKPLLAGRDPSVQGVALANLLSMWLAGHPEQLRADVLNHHIKYTKELIHISEAEIFGPKGHPCNEI